MLADTIPRKRLALMIIKRPRFLTQPSIRRFRGRAVYPNLWEGLQKFVFGRGFYQV